MDRGRTAVGRVVFRVDGFRTRVAGSRLPVGAGGATVPGVTPDPGLARPPDDARHDDAPHDRSDDAAHDRPDDRHWFQPLARFLGPAYLRNAFTRGTVQEVGFLVDALGPGVALGPGARVLDVGCGPGRHALELARRGVEVTGVDVSEAFVDLAREAAAAEGLAERCRFVLGDARELVSDAGLDAAFDAVVCLCQGGFGLLQGDDEVVLRGMARAVRPGGGVAVSAFNRDFAVRHLEEGETFDPATGVLHEVSTLRNAEGVERAFDLWTTVFTPRELRMMAERAGLTVEAVHGVTPGDYASRPPSVDRPEHLLVARRPG